MVKFINKIRHWVLNMTVIIILCFSFGNSDAQTNYVWSHGGIIRGDTTQKKIALVFSADEFGDGAHFIDSALNAKKVNASFFFTGNFLRNPLYKKTVVSLLKHGNYVGSHSDKHLLYCDWTKRDSLFVTKDSFTTDLKHSYKELKRFGIKKQDAKYFFPPYEWHNDSIAAWTKSFGLQLINFSPGTYSNADYTTPSMGKRYLPSDTIYNRILRYEKVHPNGLNGFILLLHAGTDAERTDKFYFKLPQLIEELRSLGYEFVRVDKLLK